MNDDELDEFLDRAYADFLQRTNLIAIIKYEYIAIAKHLVEFTDKEMKNDTTN